MKSEFNASVRTPGLPSLAELTGTDYRALEAIDRAWELLSVTRADSLLTAIALLAREMQPKMRPLARELAARAMDWGDRERYWPEVERTIQQFYEGPKSLELVEACPKNVGPYYCQRPAGHAGACSSGLEGES
jgi:hypothetical protein